MFYGNINSNRMKVSNKMLILNAIRKSRMSRADLARETGLTRAAVSIIIDNLISEGLVKEGETLTARYGRKGKAIRLNLENNYALGLALYRERIAYGCVDLEGNVYGYNSFTYSQTDNRDEILKKIVDGLKELQEQFKDRDFLGLGISAPGPVWTERGKILSPPRFELWQDFEIVKYFSEMFEGKVHLENMSNAMAMAESYFGKGDNYDSFAEIVMDSGIGSGIILHGNIYRGSNGLGNEIGHMTLNINGEMCSCGNRGCAEMYASDDAIVEYAKTKNRDLNSWEKIVDGAERGDIICSSILDREAEYLSTLAINIINIFDLSAVVFAGKITYKFDILRKIIKKNINDRVIAREIADIEVEKTSLDGYIEVKSSATTVLSGFFNTILK